MTAATRSTGCSALAADGQLDARVWMAPSLHFVAAKVRLWNTRATVEFLLDSIRVDQTVAQQ